MTLEKLITGTVAMEICSKPWNRFSCAFILNLIITISSSHGLPPHIFFIVVDDLGWNDVGWHNGEISTPNLNALVKGGVNINNSYVSPVCSPSRAALLTGRYPFKVGLQHGIITTDKPHGLPLSVTILPSVLKDMGYATHAIGKWHLGFCNWSYTPTNRGFDTFYGFYAGHQDHYTHRDAIGYDFRLNRSVHYTKEYSTKTYASRVEDILITHDPEKPLFVYLAFQAAHAPLQVPESYLKKYKFIKANRRKLFSGMVTAMDDAVGQIISSLMEHRMLNNTLFAFVSDNGASPENGGNNWPLRGGKGSLWDGGTRVPSFISGLGLPVKKLQGLFHAVDWFPTLIDAAKSTSPASLWTGRFKVIEGCAGHMDEWISVPRTRLEETHVIKKLKSLRRNKMAFKNCSHHVQMFDMQDDEFEMRDLSDSSYHSSILMNLREDLKKFKKQEVVPFNPGRSIDAHPMFWGGVRSPGWC